MIKKACFRFWILLWPIGICLFLYPIRNLPIRIGMAVTLCGIWIGALVFSRHRKAIFFPLVSISLLVVGFLLSPGRPPDPRDLRAAYVRSLQAYQGTRYVWGGENTFGIDCSGLVRGALIDANFHNGLSTLNPTPLRFALSLWWYDSSAHALGKEYRHQTRFLFKANAINDLDNALIQPGDIAVTTSGLHVLAYCGTNKWIEADPNPGHVIVVPVPAEKNPWFQQPINLMRWTELE